MNKIIKYILLSLFGIAFFASCEKDLDLVPRDKITEVSYFKKEEHFKLFSNQFYEYLPSFTSLFGRDYITDVIATWSQNSTSDGSYSPPVQSGLWNGTYNHIRNVNYLITKVDEAEAELKEKVLLYKAEAQFFRAYTYYNIYKDLGGVPIVTKPLNVDDAELLMAPRNTREEVINFILKDLDEAISILPAHDDISIKDIGRISKEAALAFKARVALFEGTWQKFRDKSGDKYLTQAIDAAKKVIEKNTFELFDRRDVLGDKNYKHLFLLDVVKSNIAGLTKADNKEYILCKKYDINIRPSGTVSVHNLPSPTRKFADLFLCTDGLPIEQSPLFKGRKTILSEYENRDPRMTNIMVKPFTKFWGNFPPEFIRDWDKPYEGGVEYTVNFGNETCTGYLRQKGIVEVKHPFSPDAPVIRLAEVYLVYAEALYEKNGSISDDDLNLSINRLRNRAGLPALSNAFITANNLNIRKEIRRERTIELFMEGHRFDDLRRWYIAHIEMPMSLTGVKYTGTQYETDKPWSDISFTLDAKGNVVKQVSTDRKFEEKHYLLPLPTHQLKLNKNLDQNPGWSK